MNKQKDVAERNITDYTYNGQPVTTTKARGRPIKRSNPNWFPLEKKVEACTLYAVYGNMEEVAKLSGVAEKTLREWSKEVWWDDIIKQVYLEQNDKLGGQITRLLEDSLVTLNDRLTNGDYVLNHRTNEIVRKPVDAKVLTHLFHSLAVQRRLVRGEPTSIKETRSVDDRLNKLAEEFKNFASAKTIEGDDNGNAS